MHHILIPFGGSCLLLYLAGTLLMLIAFFVYFSNGSI